MTVIRVYDGDKRIKVTFMLILIILNMNNERNADFKIGE